jgi:hypothetical protein
MLFISCSAKFFSRVVQSRMLIIKTKFTRLRVRIIIHLCICNYRTGTALLTDTHFNSHLMYFFQKRKFLFWNTEQHLLMTRHTAKQIKLQTGNKFIACYTHEDSASLEAKPRRQSDRLLSDRSGFSTRHKQESLPSYQHQPALGPPTDPSKV